MRQPASLNPWLGPFRLSLRRGWWLKVTELLWRGDGRTLKRFAAGANGGWLGKFFSTSSQSPSAFVLHLTISFIPLASVLFEQGWKRSHYQRCHLSLHESQSQTSMAAVVLDVFSKLLWHYRHPSISSQLALVPDWSCRGGRTLSRSTSTREAGIHTRQAISRRGATYAHS